MNLIFFLLFCVVVGAALSYSFEYLGLPGAKRYLIPIVIGLFFIFWFLPILVFFKVAIRAGHIPWATYQTVFSWKARFCFPLVVSYFFFVVLDALTNKGLSAVFAKFGVFGAGLIFNLAVAYFLFSIPKFLAKKGLTIKTAKAEGDLPFGLYLGTSTGHLGSLSHGAAILGGQNITLSLEDAAQNICVFGGIGSGKTTRAVQPLLSQLLEQDAGGLIFDIKGDFKQAVDALAQDAGKEVLMVGPNHTSMNLLSGLTPEVSASFLRSAFLLNQKGHHDSFWIDTATELTKNALGVLSFLPSRYSLSDLHAYLYDDTERENIDDAVRSLLASADLSERDTRLLKSYQAYQDAIFSKFDDKVKSGVNATVAQVLSPFNHPDLVDAFCTESEAAPLMEGVLDGQVFLIDLPLAIWGLGGKVAYNFIKLRFFNVLQRRNSESSWDKERPVFFMCDEFQEIVSANKDGLSDLNFWDKSRSSKCIGIISAQAVSSFYAAIGDHDVANTLLQNFRQKLVFRTEDRTTIELINHLLGRVEVERVSSSTSKTSGIRNESTTTSESRSTTEKQVLNPQAFRALGPNQAVALLSVSGYSMDDVVETVPVFIN
jgi:type IV secretory pathway TraG/TraD family ATPase VirD4